MAEEKHHITSYKTYLLVLSLLIVFTLLSVAITQIELSRWAAAAALLVAGIKSTFVLMIFMHLKYDQRMFRVMVGLIVALVVVVIIITMLDFLFR
ncbi:MAG: cytochrome C oxidase subunit IV family protein [Bacteroidales bacterium]|nr:cytochrome C oxidase subunit IV family protein [Bacteroidales bacterium]MDT8431948.1 cytochrome C oxidase subunit IV family protein [Bacteroidales bacterium]